MKHYNPSELEPKWQAIWEETKAYEAHIDPSRPKTYVAGMFPYPSGAGLHTGHARNYSIVDVIARFHRQLGKNVLNPIGWDTFGLPSENYAIKTGTAPAEITAINIQNFKKQLKRLGMSFDWSRELTTSDPSYYKWTQWIFTKLFERGLAYQKESYQWWDPIDKTVLANEQVINGRSDRSGAIVEKRLMKQWFFKITAYAEELLADLDELDWPESIKAQQRNWIGKSVGAEIVFQVIDQKDTITVFSTRVDTLFGATFLVLAPEHPLVSQLVNDDTKEAVDAYVARSIAKSEVERMSENREKTGVFTGSHAINPATGEAIPIWVADYVLTGYGTGAVMGVPAHDERDFAFAESFGLPIIEVIERPEGSDEQVYHGEGVLVNSDRFNGMRTEEAREELVAWLEESGIGQARTTYKMRDWLISRQRYWGAPIPIAFDSKGEAHAIPETDLPVVLPDVDDYKPDGTGKGVLARNEAFRTVMINGEEMIRETDTMDGFACSSWYLLRYTDPHDETRAWDPDKANYWSPLDFYCGGDHAVAHLLYVRFWTHVFKDMGLVDFAEPVKKLVYNGYINAADGTKMSKSKGNTVDPLELVEAGYGADALRVYELFIGPYELDASWDPRGIAGTHRFLNRVWTLVQEYLATEPVSSLETDDALQRAEHTAIKKVTEDLHRLSFNTAISALMEYTNELFKLKTSGYSSAWQSALENLARLVAPFAPHIGEELWRQLGHEILLHDAGWPTWDDRFLERDEMNIMIQVNGKLRGKLTVERSMSSDDIQALALREPKVIKHLEQKEPAKVIYIPGRLVNIVI